MAKAKKATGKTSVTFLLDRTGSMQSIKDDTIGAFNAYLDGLRQDGTGIEFSLVQFDSQSIDKTCVRLSPKDVANLTDATYQPRASTPLVDAAYKTIKAVEKSLDGDKDAKVVICIQTDGQENASTEYSFDDLNALIKEKTGLGWQFNFMGAGIDAYAQGQRMGIAASATMSYDNLSPRATRAAFHASASNTRSFAAGLSATTNYSAGQKSAAGDKFVGLTRAQPAPTAPTATSKAATRHKIVDDISL